MTEITIVRENLMTQLNYSPYCGSCVGPRAVWNGNQFGCPKCSWVSEFPKDFIDRYKLKWGK